MKTLVDTRLREEATRFLFRFGCEHCAHHVPERGECAEGFPSAPHRAVHLPSVETLEFCKSFELA